MSEKPKEDVRQNHFTFGFDDQANPSIMVISIPLRRCANDLEDGQGLLIGRVKELTTIALKMLREMRDKKAGNGIVRPNGPIGPLQVH